MIISYFPSGSSGGIVPSFTYTGSYDMVAEATGWKIKFLTSGTLTMLDNAVVDIFLVGGGGNGNPLSREEDRISGNTVIIDNYYGAGGSGGYVSTYRSVSLASGSSYTITVGTPGNASSFGTYTVLGGGDYEGNYTGGSGGSGGASGGLFETNIQGGYYGGEKRVTGGRDGNDGMSAVSGVFDGGSGTHSTTREFGDPSGDLYASGGNAYSKYETPDPIVANTGNGGHGGKSGYEYGATGIVIIRNARA